MDSEGVDSIPDNIFDIIPECVADVCNPGKTSQGTVAAAKSQTQSQLLADSVLSAWLK